MARIQTTGAELKLFLSEADNEGWADMDHEGMFWQINGAIKSDAEVDVSSLADTDDVFLDGDIEYTEETVDFAAAMINWRMARRS